MHSAAAHRQPMSRHSRESLLGKKALLALMALASVLSLACPAVASAQGEEEKPKEATFAPIGEKSQAQMTTCGGWCGARDLILNSDQSLTIPVRRVGPEGEVEPIASRLVLQRQQDGGLEVVHGEKVDFAAAEDAGEQDRFEIDLGQLDEPGEYTGALLFDLSNGADPVSVPVTLKVRKGPLLPLIFLIAAVFLGWGIRRVFDQRGAAKLRREARELKTRIQGLPDSERSVLTPLWAQVWEERNTDQAAAETHLKALKAGADALRRCRNADDDVLRLPYAPELTTWRQRVGSALSQLIRAVESFSPAYEDKVAVVTGAQRELKRAAEIESELDELDKRAKAAEGAGDPYKAFQQAAKELREAIEEAPADASEAAPDLEPLWRQVEQAFEKLEEAHDGPLEQVSALELTGGGLRKLTRDGGAAPLGWPEGDAAGFPEERWSAFDFRAALGDSLGGIATMTVTLVLLAIGFKLMYLDNATFGASLTDWLALVFWGLAAYGARQALTGLGPSPKPEK